VEPIWVIVIIAAVLVGVGVGALVTLTALRLGIRVGAHGADAVTEKKPLPKPFVPRQ